MQLAAVALNPRTLEYNDTDTFCSFIRPESFEEIPHDNTLWHCNQRNITEQEWMKTLEEAPEVQNVWKDFCNFVSRYNPSGGYFKRPIACGYNIKNYDMIIVDRLCQRFGPYSKKEQRQLVFNGFRIMDLMDYAFLWFESSSDIKNFKLETLRDYFGMSQEGAHDALEDVEDTAAILIRFMNLHRRLLEKVQFKGSMKGM